VFSYPDVVSTMVARPPMPYPRFPCVTRAWDNTARRRHGGTSILNGSIPTAYGH
jgi:hypothetical protein